MNPDEVTKPEIKVEAVKGEVIGETVCECGWRLPIRMHSQFRNTHVTYECPHCGTGFYMEARK